MVGMTYKYFFRQQRNKEMPQHILNCILSLNLCTLASSSGLLFLYIHVFVLQMCYLLVVIIDKHHSVLLYWSYCSVADIGPQLNIWNEMAQFA